MNGTFELNEETYPEADTLQMVAAQLVLQAKEDLMTAVRERAGTGAGPMSLVDELCTELLRTIDDDDVMAQLTIRIGTRSVGVAALLVLMARRLDRPEAPVVQLLPEAEHVAVLAITDAAVDWLADRHASYSGTEMPAASVHDSPAVVRISYADEALAASADMSARNLSNRMLRLTVDDGDDNGRSADLQVFVLDRSVKIGQLGGPPLRWRSTGRVVADDHMEHVPMSTDADLRTALERMLEWHDG